MNKKIETKNIQFPNISEIYKQSKIDAENYFDDCIILSVKTSNNQDSIEKMEFWKFRNLMKSLNKYIEAESKQSSGENPEFEKQKKDFNRNLSNQKRNFKNNNQKPKLK